MKFFIDFDGTLGDSISACCGLYNEKYREYPGFAPVNPEDIHSWAMSELVCCQNVESLFDDPDLWKHMKLFPGAYETLWALNERGHDITICTIGTLANIQGKAEFLRRELPFIDNHIFLNTGGKMDKSIIDMRGAVIIDDRLDVIMKSNAKWGIVFGNEYEWNKGVSNYVRMKTWSEIKIWDVMNFCSYVSGGGNGLAFTQTP